jgi:WD40 repeat protein
VSRLFISHSSRNDDWAIALRDWLVREGWSGPGDIFLDLDPEHGLVAGERWARALEDAATRCEAVLFLVSKDWVASKWCSDEYQLANKFNKKLFALLVDDVPFDHLPGGLSAQWQVVRLKGEPAERFLTVHPRTQLQSPVAIAEAGLKSLKRGLEKAGIGPGTFELQHDPTAPFGWRAPYRGLEALEPEDAAVFFGRSADIVRGIDALRGLAARKPPRLLVILGASGAGKSSFLRAGLWPRLLRDDGQWLPLRAIRAGRGGAIDGSEGLLAAIEEAHRRFDLRTSRATLRERIATPEHFVELLRELRQAAARRALVSQPPFPLPVLCLDQGEELFAPDAGPEADKLLQLARVAMDADEALLLVTIRSDSYGSMQSAKTLAEIDQVPLSLGPVPHGEIARVIREPSEVLRRKVGPAAPVFDAAVVEHLQAEIEGETDALPLLAFVLQRLMREHEHAGTIGLPQLMQTGGVAAAIELEAEAALADSGQASERAERREALRRLFIPRLARIDRESKAPQRRGARQSELPPDLLPLARALMQRRLLVAKLAGQAEGPAAVDAATLEVAHEALLRRWPTLAELLAEDRDALLLLDGVLLAAADWEKAEAAHKPDFLAHRGSRLAEALTLAARGLDWEREIIPARAYLAECQAREAAEREEKEAALAREQARLAEIASAQTRTAHLQRRAHWTLAAMAVVVALGLGAGLWQYRINLTRQAQLDRGHVNLVAELATSQRLAGNFDGGLRLAVHAARTELGLKDNATKGSLPQTALAAAIGHSELRLTLAGHQQNNVLSAAFSPDGTRIITTSYDRTARIWDAATGEEIAILRGHEHSVGKAAFSRDGSRIVTASIDQTARVWDATTYKELMVLRGHTQAVNSAAFSPDGSRVVTASGDNTARIWDAATGKQIAILAEKREFGGYCCGTIATAAYSPDGALIVTAEHAGKARIWDAETAQQVSLIDIPGQLFYSAAFSPDGTRIVTASSDKTARVFETATGKELAVMRGHEAGVWTAAFNSDGTRIVTVSTDKSARIWDAAKGQLVGGFLTRGAYPRSAAFSPDDSRVVVALEDKTARVYAVAPTRELAIMFGHEDILYAAASSPDGTRIATASRDKTARVWDAASGRELAVLRGHTGLITGAAFSPDGTRVATASADKTARIWDIATAGEIAVLTGHASDVKTAVFSPDGSRVLTGATDGTARIYDAATAKEITVLRGHRDMIMSAAFSPDGSRIVTASVDKTARVWDAATGKETAVLEGHTGHLKFAAFSPDGSRVVTASEDESARIWDATSGRQIAVLPHGQEVFSASFNPDGSRIVTAAKTNAVHIWDTATAREIAVLRRRGSFVRFAAFHPDGVRILVASEDKTARIWEAPIATMSTRELMAGACQSLRGLTNLTRDEMRLVGYAEDAAEIDVCPENGADKARDGAGKVAGTQ